eukprot:6206195-Pleurochrysis_carterae.AAC.2
MRPGLCANLNDSSNPPTESRPETRAQECTSRVRTLDANRCAESGNAKSWPRASTLQARTQSARERRHAFGTISHVEDLSNRQPRLVSKHVRRSTSSVSS